MADGVQTIQKDAILRQWKETKREKSELQKTLDRVQPKKVELEERLRLYDMALDQVSDLSILMSNPDSVVPRRSERHRWRFQEPYVIRRRSDL